MMMRRTTIYALVAMPLLAAPVAASAGPPPADAPPSASQGDAEADALFQKGSEAFDAGKVDKAYELFSAAWKLKRTHDIAGNLAQVELALSKKRDAAEHIAFALANFPPSVRSDRRDKMKKALEGLRKELAVLRVKVSVADAKVSIDGAPVGISPLPPEVFVNPGAHVVEAKLDGYQLATERAEVLKGTAQDVTLTLVRLPPQPPPVPPGGEKPRPNSARLPVIVTGAVLGGAGIVLGAVFTGISNGKASSADASLKDLVAQRGYAACAQAAASGCAELHSLIGQRSTFGSAAAWTFIGGGVVGASTLVYALVAPRTLPVQVTPVVTGQEGGLVVRGTW